MDPHTRPMVSLCAVRVGRCRVGRRIAHARDGIVSESIGIIGMEGNSIKPELSAIDAQKQ